MRAQPFRTPATLPGPLRIGRIAYLNVVPFFHDLRDSGFQGEIVDGVPSELNRMLAAGSIDACPSSSFEYAVHAADYLLLPGHSISSIGSVHSVLLFCPGPLHCLSGAEIALTGESATSVNLLKIILLEFCGIRDVRFHSPQEPIEDLLQRGQPVLLIGDRALAAAGSFHNYEQIVDLGQFWYQRTGLPFVFALWILRRQSVARDREGLLTFARQLQQSRQRAFADLNRVAQALSGQEVLDCRQMVRYWRELSYDLTDQHLQGLLLYFTLCHKYGLLSEVPELQFLSPD